MSVSHLARSLSSPHRPIVPMKPSARLYHCAGCHCQVFLCRHCDRGNLYCGCGCAERARKASLRRAGSRYRSTRRARLANAARQGRFRARQKQKVTHQGSLPMAALVLLLGAWNKPESPQETPRSSATPAIHCHVCGCECEPWLRRDFLRPTERARQARSP
jgi:hypothetical protein